MGVLLRALSGLGGLKDILGADEDVTPKHSPVQPCVARLDAKNKDSPK